MSGARAEAVNLDPSRQVDSGEGTAAASAPGDRALRADAAVATATATPDLVSCGQASGAVPARWSRLLASVLPWRCVLCGGAGERCDLCARCAAALPRNRPCCARCALPLGLDATACGACARRPPRWRALHAPYRYAWPLDRLVARLKFAASLASGAVLAQLLAEDGAVRDALAGCDAVVPVPLAHARLRRRGFNQALELARPLARSASRPLAASWLARPRDTEAQSGLAAAARARNVRGAFVASPAAAGLGIALVDDVVTTGATAAACCDALLAAGASSVVVLAIARAPPPAS